MAFTMLSSPVTPTPTRHYTYSHPPAMSSPLASSDVGSSPPHSPTNTVQRRKAQFKSFGHMSSPSADRRASTRRSSNRGPIPFSLTPRDQAAVTPEPSRNNMLRERFKARCIERAREDRASRVKGKRRGLDLSSDGPDELMVCDEDGDEDMLNDPFFQRIMSSIRRKEKHSYRVSYERDVGSSFDPDMEDMDEWERLLKVNEPTAEAYLLEDLDDEALAEYAAEHELLEGLDPDEVFSYSDVDDYPTYEETENQISSALKGKGRAYDDDDMDMD